MSATLPWSLVCCCYRGALWLSCSCHVSQACAVVSPPLRISRHLACCPFQPLFTISRSQVRQAIQCLVKACCQAARWLRHFLHSPASCCTCSRFLHACPLHKHCLVSRSQVTGAIHFSVKACCISIFWVHCDHLHASCGTFAGLSHAFPLNTHSPSPTQHTLS
jgi:hypothetical protein